MRRRRIIALSILLLAAPLQAGPPSRAPVEPPIQDDWCAYNGVMEPAWSPDGTRIAAIVWWIHVPSYFLESALSITTWGGGGESGCFLWTGFSRPAWSPDAREIAFADFGGAISTTTADGCDWPDFRRVAAGSRATDLAWSPDGTRIAFTSDEADIWTAQAAGGGLRPLVHGPFRDIQPAWSPDGRFIAFASDRQGSFDIWIAPVDRHEALQLTGGPARDTWPTWSPDGRFLAFASDRAGGTHVWSVSADGGVPVQITFGPGEETAPAWSPRGDRIAFLATEGRCSWVGVESNLRLVGVEVRSWTAVKRLYR